MKTGNPHRQFRTASEEDWVVRVFALLCCLSFAAYLCFSGIVGYFISHLGYPATR